MKRDQSHASSPSVDFQPFFDAGKFAKLLQQKQRPGKWQAFWHGVDKKRKEIYEEILGYRSGRGN